MLYHYVLTVQSRRRRWSRRCAHTVSGHAQVDGQLVEKVVYDRVYAEVVSARVLNPSRTTTVFYRLVPEMATLELGEVELDVKQADG